MPAGRAARGTARGDRLRVAFYVHSPQVGGAETFLRALVGALGPGIDPVLVSVDEDVARLVGSLRPDLETVVVPRVRGRLDLRTIRAHSRVLGGLAPDVVHVNQHHVWAGQYGLLAARLARLPAIGVVHGVFPHTSESQRLLTIVIARGVARYVGVSRFAAGALRRMLVLPERRVVVIPLGVDGAGAADFPGPGARDPDLVAVVARLAPEKGVDVLLDAMAHAPGLELVVVGDGVERPRLEQQARSLGLAGRVRFAGWCPDPWALRPVPSALVVPSRREAGGLAAIEAMHRGLPLVASRVGGLVDLVTEETGVLVPPEDPRALATALRSLLDQPDRLAAMGRSASERARAEHSIEVMAERYGRLYHEVATGAT